MKKSIPYLIILIFVMRMLKKDDEKLTGKITDMAVDKETKEKFANAMKAVIAKYGSDIAQNVERIYRWETAHFKSLKYYNSAGMEVFNEKYPFGWGKELTPFIKENKKYGPASAFEKIVLKEGGTGKNKTFVNFPTLEGAVMFLGYVMECRGNNRGAWFSHNEDSQTAYNEKTSKVTPIITNALLKTT